MAQRCCRLALAVVRLTICIHQMPLIAGGNGMPTGYPTGGASAIGMMNNTAGGLDMRTNMQGSWMLSQPQQAPTHTSIPGVLPGGDARLAMNHMQGPQGTGQYGMQGTGQYGGGNNGNAQQLANLQQLQNLQRLAAFNQVRPVSISVSAGDVCSTC